LLPALVAQNHAKTLFQAVWQERQPEIQQRYQESLAEYEQQLKAAQAEMGGPRNGARSLAKTADGR
jgi:hypothetical protein